MTKAEFEKRESIIRKLTEKALVEIDAEDIVDFWAEMSGGMISKDLTHTGKVTYEDYYETETFDSIEDAADAGLNTILEWAMDGDEDAVTWLLENGVDVQDAMDEADEADETEDKADDAEDTDEADDAAPMLISTTDHTVTYDVAGTLYKIDIVTQNKDGKRYCEAYLYRRDYGVKDLMFGAENYDAGEFLELVRCNLSDYIEGYKKTYEGDWLGEYNL